MRVGLRVLLQVMAATVVVASLAACEPAPPRSQFQVVGPGGGFDSNPGDGVCADGSGTCSLPAALHEAGALGGADIDVPAGNYGSIGMWLYGDIRINPGEAREVVVGLNLTVDGHLALNGVISTGQIVVNGSLHAVRSRLLGSSLNPVPLTVSPGAGVILEDSLATSSTQALVNGGSLVAFGSTFHSTGATTVVDTAPGGTTVVQSSAIVNGSGSGGCAGTPPISLGYTHIEAPCGSIPAAGDSNGSAWVWTNAQPGAAFRVDVTVPSPLVDVIPPDDPACRATLDVLGNARGADGDGYGETGCDIGAVERQYAGPHLGSISGTVRSDVDGAPIEGVRVVLSTWGHSVLTDAEGHYTLTHVSPGAHHIYFEGGPAGFVNEYYDDSLEVWTQIDVAEGEEITGIDAGLAVAGRIQGRLVRDADGSPVPAVSAIAYSSTEDWHLVGNGSSDEDGYFEITGLPPGDYRIHLWAPESPVLGEFFDDVATIEEATTVTVGPGDSVDLQEIGLRIISEVAGQVTSDESGDPVPGASVTVWNFDGFSRSTSTDSLGRYVFDQVPNGSYYVDFHPPYGNPDNLVHEFWGDSYDFPGAQVLDVTWAGRVGIDAGLATGGSVSGHVVRAEDSSPIAAADVQTMFGAYSQGVRTNGQGAYEIRGLPVGPNTFLVQGPAGEDLVAFTTTLQVTAGSQTIQDVALLGVESIPGNPSTR